MPIEVNGQQLFPTPEAVEYCGISAVNFKFYVHVKKSIKPAIKISRVNHYRQADLDALKDSFQPRGNPEFGLGYQRPNNPPKSKAGPQVRRKRKKAE